MDNKTVHQTIDTKHKILKAAAHIINTEGVLSLTLEAVAKEAGLSKGGLLYHFPSKDALMEGMNDYLLNRYMTKLKNVADIDSDEKGGWTRGYVTETFHQLDNEYDMNAAFLAAAGTNPTLFASMKEQFTEIQSLVENDRIDPIVATVVKLAVDGLYFNELFGQLYLTKELRGKILHFLIDLTREKV